MIRCFLPILIFALTACGGRGDNGSQDGRGGGGKWGGKRSDKVADWRVLVETTSATVGSVANQLVTHGSLESEAMADITAETAGVVTAIKAEEGQTVTRGQVLAVLSNPSLEAGSERARLELSAAERRYDQSQKLHSTGAISDSEFLEAKDAFGIAQASFREASGTRGFTRLTSPVDGTVSARNVRLGELASGATPAFQVVDLNKLRVIVNLSERDLTHLTVGQVVTLSGTYDTTIRSSGSVLRISPVVDELTGTVRVTIAVDPTEDGKPHLRPGQFVEVRIEVDRHTDVVTVPRSAIYWLDGSPIAWRVVDKPEDEKKEKDEEDEETDDGFFSKFFSDDAKEDEEEADPWVGVPRRIAERVNLTLGYTDADKAEVAAGIDAGDLVVTVGGDNLRPDAAVKLPGDPSPAKPKKGKDKSKSDKDAGEKG